MPVPIISWNGEKYHVTLLKLIGNLTGRNTLWKKNLKKEICWKAILFGSVVFCMSPEQEHG